MTARTLIAKLSNHDGVNYVVTNFIPRRLLTRFVGWLSKIEHPLVRDASIGFWRLFSDLDLSEARTSAFKSLHDCFIRELKPGARPVDTRREIVVSPCDAIVGANGLIEGDRLLQVKGSEYPLSELVRDADVLTRFRGGRYVTLRLTSTMYHRFHAPADARIVSVSHIAGDTFNVNPPTLQRLPRVFCRNERGVIRLRLAGASEDVEVAMIPVAAILVAGLKLNFMELPRNRHHALPWSTPCDVSVAKGAELGWFEHGSTIIVLAPRTFQPAPALRDGHRIRMGEAIFSMPI